MDLPNLPPEYLMLGYALIKVLEWIGKKTASQDLRSIVKGAAEIGFIFLLGFITAQSCRSQTDNMVVVSSCTQVEKPAK